MWLEILFFFPYDYHMTFKLRLISLEKKLPLSTGGLWLENSLKGFT